MPTILFRTLLFCAVTLTSSFAAERRPMTPLDVVKLPALGDKAVSPDGQWLLYAQSLLNWQKGKRYSDLFLVRMDGSQARRMTFTSEANETPFAWSRQSDAFAFLSDREGSKKQVFWMSLGGGEARRLTEEKEGVENFALSRDGRRLAYLAGPPENRQIKLIDLAEIDKPARALTEHKTGVKQWLWHPDSSRILFTAPEEDESIHERRKKRGFDVKVNDWKESAENVWSIGVETRDSKRITSHPDRQADRLKISRNGKFLAYVGKTTERYGTRWDDELYLLNLSSGETRRVTENSQPEGSFEFSPGGQWLAYTGPDRSEQYRATKIFLVPTGSAGGARKLLAGWDYDGDIGFWTPGGENLYFSTTVGVNRQAFYVPASGGQPEQITSGDQVVSVEFDHDSGKLLLSRGAAGHPTEIFTAEIARLGSPETWVRLTGMAESIEKFQLGRYETVRWKSTDGKQVEGLLIKPAGYEEGKRYPLVVQVHGGPAGTSTHSFSSSWSTYTHVFAGKGYAVFQPNYRGSSGYGEEFRRQIAGDYFRQGFEDIMTGVDFLIGRGIADPEKLGHMGWSAGGHWSNWALTHTGRFKAISSGAGAVNWISMWAQSDMQINREFYFQGKPYENPEHYREVSPITYIKNAKTPTLILCGTADERVPNPQSRELYVSLQKLGVPVEYIEFPDMPHGITNPRYQLVKMTAELAWFDKWIHGREGWIDWEELLKTVPDETKADSSEPN